MKKLLFLLLFLSFFVALNRAYALQYKHVTFTYPQLKKTIRFIAKKAGFHVRFVPETSDMKSKDCMALESQKFACNTLFGYLNTYPKKAFHLTKKDYRQIFFNFVGSYFPFISPYGKNSYYVIYFGAGAGFGALDRAAYQMDIYALENNLPVKTKYPLAYLSPAEFNYLKNFDGPELIFINKKLQLVNFKNKKQVADTLYKKALFFINKNLLASNKKINTFGFSKAGLRLLMFNITDPEFLRAAQESLQPIMAGSNATASGAVGTAGFQADAQIIGNIANANASANSSLENIYSRFINISSNKKYLYDNVNSYYTKALIGRFGELKTSFLQNAGIAHETDISYITILQKANKFLSYVNQNKQNLNTFNMLLNKKFKPGVGLKRQSYYPNVRSVEKWYITAIDTVQWRMTTLNNTTYYDLGLLTTYTEPTLDTVNFYSLTYYLIKNLYSRNANPKAKKLFRDIVLGKYKSALRLLKINNTVHYSKKIDKFWHYVSIKKYKKALSYVSNYNTCVQADYSNRGGFNSCNVWHNFKAIVLYNKLKDIQNSDAPWDKSKRKFYLKRMYKLTKVFNADGYGFQIKY